MCSPECLVPWWARSRYGFDVKCPECGGKEFERVGALARCTVPTLIGLVPGRPLGPHPMYGSSPDVPVYEPCGSHYIADATIVTVL